jgi:glutamate decarboxylase
MVARHQAFPCVKSQGWHHERPILLTSQESHYSLRKAAEICGMGAQAVWSVKCDEAGKMIPSELRLALRTARQRGFQVFYVNATAGTTVRGAFDPIDEIADICHDNGIWLHVDASLGGGLIFSETEAHKRKLRGIDRANSITMNPHKMLGVPVTCSFLLGNDLRKFWAANTVDAEYLFHETPSASTESLSPSTTDTNTMFDLADLTPQCGRKGDSLKLALGWVYYGRSGYGRYVDTAMNSAAHLAQLVQSHEKLSLVGSIEPECVQVCFYYKLGGSAAGHTHDCNTKTSAAISERLPIKGFMVDYAPGPEGKMLRVVTNGSTEVEMLGRLVDAIVELGNGSEVHHICK